MSTCDAQTPKVVLHNSQAALNTQPLAGPLISKLWVKKPPSGLPMDLDPIPPKTPVLLSPRAQEY